MRDLSLSLALACVCALLQVHARVSTGTELTLQLLEQEQGLRRAAGAGECRAVARAGPAPGLLVPTDAPLLLAPHASHNRREQVEEEVRSPRRTANLAPRPPLFR